MTEWWQGFAYGALVGWLVSLLVITVVMILIAGGTRRLDRVAFPAPPRSGRRNTAEPAFSGKKPPAGTPSAHDDA